MKFHQQSYTSLPYNFWRLLGNIYVSPHSMNLKEAKSESRLWLGSGSFFWFVLAVFLMRTSAYRGFPGGSDGKESACNAGDPGSIPGSERSPGEGKGYPLLYSCLENLTDREAWWSTVHGVWKSWTNTTEQLTLSAYHELLDFLDFFSLEG